MFLAPLAEAPPIGRKPVYLITLLIFVLFNFAVVYAPNIATLLAFRFLTVGNSLRQTKRTYTNGFLGIHWFSSTCNRWCIASRPLVEKEGCICHWYLGCRRRLRPCTWSISRWFRSTT